MKPRVVIIGAGPGGLAAAMLLARAGAQVKVLERRDRVGGRTSALEAEGFRFDIGPTFFLYPKILEEIFAACGRDFRSEVELLRLEPMYRVIFEGGGSLGASGDLSTLCQEVARLCPEDALQVPRAVADNRRKLEAFKPILETPFNGVRSLFSTDLLRSLPYLRPTRSVDDDLARFFRDPRVRLAFSFQSKYLGMSPFKCPSLFTILAFLEYEYGVFHPRGGCAAVSEAMARVAQDLGVEIHTGETVEEVLFAGRQVVGVRTASARHLCDALVVNADFAHAMTRLVPDRLRRRWTDARIESKRFSCSTFMLYLGIEGEVPLDHHTIYLARDYEDNLKAIEDGRLPERPSLYLQNACATDRSLAPPGHSTLYVLVPVPHATPQIDWAEACQGYRRLVLRRLEDLGLKGLETRIRYEKMVTPADWEADLHIFKGATFNLAHNLGQMLHRRPRNRFEDLDGVYLVGGGTHPGSGLPVIFEGARITARLMAEDLKLAAFEQFAVPEPIALATPRTIGAA